VATNGPASKTDRAVSFESLKKITVVRLKIILYPLRGNGAILSAFSTILYPLRGRNIY
jgi:hypothetical protein